MRMTQLAFPLLRSKRTGGLVTPVPIAWQKASRQAHRALGHVNCSPANLFPAFRLLEDQALLDQIRRGARSAARAGGRMSKRAMFVYVCKPEGQRVTRAIAQLSERIAAQEALLCG